MFLNKKYFLILLMVVFEAIYCKRAFAQDPQISMFYAISQYISPSFVGTGYNPRVVLNHRLQWPANQARYATIFTGIDTFFPKKRMGIGLLAMYDEQGSGIYLQNSSPTLKTLDLTLQASYEFYLNHRVTCRPGIGLGVVNRKLVDNFLYPNQLNNQGNNGQASGEDLVNASIFYPDVSAGILFFSPAMWLGGAIHHINRPNYSFLKDNSNRQDFKINIHFGYKINITRSGGPKYYLAREKEYSLSPIIHYRLQNRADQFDLGLAGVADQFLYGVWYRGLPLIKDYNKKNINSEAVIVMVGWVYKGWNFNYAYDITASKLTGYTSGSHEINLAYVLSKPKNRFKYRRLPCPNHLKDTNWDINRQHDHDGLN